MDVFATRRLGPRLGGQAPRTPRPNIHVPPPAIDPIASSTDDPAPADAATVYPPTYEIHVDAGTIAYENHSLRTAKLGPRRPRGVPGGADRSSRIQRVFWSAVISKRDRCGAIPGMGPSRLCSTSEITGIACGASGEEHHGNARDHDRQPVRPAHDSPSSVGRRAANLRFAWPAVAGPSRGPHPAVQKCQIRSIAPITA
jgi:hypothetical protein